MRPFIAILMLVFLSACSEEPSVEQQIIATLRAMEYAAEDGDHFDFIAHVADSFSGQQETMNRQDFHRFMIFQINQHRRLQGQFLPIYVTETGETTATANFRILVTGGGGLVPDRGRLFQVETDWTREGDDWLLDGANWKGLDLSSVDLP